MIYTYADNHAINFYCTIVAFYNKMSRDVVAVFKCLLKIQVQCDFLYIIIQEKLT